MPPQSENWFQSGHAYEHCFVSPQNAWKSVVMSRSFKMATLSTRWSGSEWTVSVKRLHGNGRSWQDEQMNPWWETLWCFCFLTCVGFPCISVGSECSLVHLFYDLLRHTLYYERFMVAFSVIGKTCIVFLYVCLCVLSSACTTYSGWLCALVYMSIYIYSWAAYGRCG